MRPIVVALLLCAFTGLAAVAEDGDAGAGAGTGGNECIEAAGSVAPDFPLPHVAQAIAGRKLDIAVIGSASSELSGPAGTNIAYPTSLEKSLRGVLPGVTVKVTTYARPRETASEMQASFERILGESKPALVIWQTGTADALRGIDPDEFRASLDDGIDKLRAADSDVVFMNMQYSPRIEAMLAITPYADTMRVVAVQREVVLFDRFDIMKRWNESGIFDLYRATRTTNIAEKVHGCLGRLLADVVMEGVRMAPPPARSVN
jgi:hypothetical protein